MNEDCEFKEYVLASTPKTRMRVTGQFTQVVKAVNRSYYNTSINETEVGKRKWEAPDGKYRLRIVEDSLEKAKMSGKKNLKLTGPSTIQRRHSVCLRNKIMCIQQLRNHYRDGESKISMMQKKNPTEVLVIYFFVFEGKINFHIKEYFMEVLQLSSLFCRLTVLGETKFVLKQFEIKCAKYLLRRSMLNYVNF